MWFARLILGFVAAWLTDVIGGVVSLLMLLAAIACVFAIAVGTIRWLGAGWLLLTMPATIVLGLPVWRRMAQVSERLDL